MKMENAGYIATNNLYNKTVEETSEPSTTLFNNLIWLTTDEAAFFLRKSTHALRQMVYKGKIRAKKFSGRLYFRKDDLHELIETSYY